MTAEEALKLIISLMMRADSPTLFAIARKLFGQKLFCR